MHPSIYPSIYLYHTIYLSKTLYRELGAESLDKEVEWRQWFGGTQGGRGSLDKEVEWRQWFSGTQWGGKFKYV